MAPRIDDDMHLCVDLKVTASHDMMDVDLPSSSFPTSKFPPALHPHVVSDDDDDDDTAMTSTSEVSTSSSHRRSVSFACTNNQTHDVLSRYDYTSEEIAKTWYDRVDLRQFKATAKSEARLLDQGLLNTKNSCVRGLECRTQGGSRTKRQRRSNALAVVFMELDNQEMNGYTDDDAVADAYWNYSEPCAAHAHMIAVRDHQDAVQCWESSSDDNGNSNNNNNQLTATFASTTSAAAAATAEFIDHTLFSTTNTNTTATRHQGILACSAA